MKLRIAVFAVVFLLVQGLWASNSGAISSSPGKGHIAAACINVDSTHYVTITELSASMMDTTEALETVVYLYDFTNQQNAPTWQFWMGVNPPYTIYASTPDVQPQPSSYSNGFSFPMGHTVCLTFEGVSTNAYETANISWLILP